MRIRGLAQDIVWRSTGGVPTGSRLSPLPGSLAAVMLAVMSMAPQLRAEVSPVAALHTLADLDETHNSADLGSLRVAVQPVIEVEISRFDPSQLRPEAFGDWDAGRSGRHPADASTGERTALLDLPAVRAGTGGASTVRRAAR